MMVAPGTGAGSSWPRTLSMSVRVCWYGRRVRKCSSSRPSTTRRREGDEAGALAARAAMAAAPRAAAPEPEPEPEPEPAPAPRAAWVVAAAANTARWACLCAATERQPPVEAAARARTRSGAGQQRQGPSGQWQGASGRRQAPWRRQNRSPSRTSRGSGRCRDTLFEHSRPLQATQARAAQCHSIPATQGMLHGPRRRVGRPWWPARGPRVPTAPLPQRSKTRPSGARGRYRPPRRAPPLTLAAGSVSGSWLRLAGCGDGLGHLWGADE